MTALALLALAGTLPVLYLANGDGRQAIADCSSRGVEYFKEIGSYPTLNSPPERGRPAEEVARERCGRTTTAFPQAR